MYCKAKAIVIVAASESTPYCFIQTRCSCGSNTRENQSVIVHVTTRPCVRCVRFTVLPLSTLAVAFGETKSVQPHWIVVQLFALSEAYALHAFIGPYSVLPLNGTLSAYSTRLTQVFFRTYTKAQVKAKEDSVLRGDKWHRPLIATSPRTVARSPDGGAH